MSSRSLKCGSCDALQLEPCPDASPAICWDTVPSLKSVNIAVTHSMWTGPEWSVERAAGVAENDGAGAGLREVAERGYSGLNRPLTARCNLTFHWLRNVYSPHWTVCSLLFQSPLFYSSCTCLVTCLNPVQPFPNITQVNAFLTRPNPSRRHDAF